MENVANNTGQQYLTYKPRLKRQCIILAAASVLSLIAAVLIIFLPTFSIDLLIETETALYPVNVQKGDTLGKADWRSFEKLARLSGLEKPVGTGAAIGLTPRAFAVSDTAVAHGPEWIWERRLTLGRARLTEDANEDASA